MIRRLLLIFAAAAFAALPQTSSDDDVILRAMRDEMDRSRQLRVVAGGGDDIPYFISYSLTDAENFRVTASMGAAVNIGHNRSRVPVVEVRVGSYDFDDTGHIYSGIYTGSRFDNEWPIDDNYATLRECFWLATDRAYKTALESMARKRAALSGASAPPEKLPDFSRADPVKLVNKVTRKKVDEAAWQARMVKLSGVFNSYPEVRASVVEFEAINGVTYVMNNEGTAVRYSDDIAYAYAKAEGQAPDGMLVRDATTFEALDLDKLGSEAEMRKALAGVAENVRALTKAPQGADFSGPTLFEPQAAAQLLAQVLGDNLEVPRKPLAEPGRAVNFLPSELETKIGSRILADWINVTDDPTQTTWNGRPLAGNDVVDLEGVVPKPVSIVEKGVLKNFLTTRQPLKNFPVSNGHARLPGAYGAKSAAISNLFIKASQLAARGFEEEADRHVQGARQAVRDAGAEARLSVFVGHGRAQTVDFRRVAVRIGAAREPSGVGLPGVSGRAGGTGPRASLPRAFDAHAARYPGRFAGDRAVRLCEQLGAAGVARRGRLSGSHSRGLAGNAVRRDRVRVPAGTASEAARGAAADQRELKV